MSHPIGRQRNGGLRSGCLWLMVLLGVIVGVVAVAYFQDSQSDSDLASDNPVVEDTQDFTESQSTTAPTFTPQSERRIFFPNAETAGLIVEAYKQPGGWDVSSLQDLVGHLEGTPWLGEGGNIVLAGHFEDELGRPGPFRYLYFAEVGDRIFIQDGADSALIIYEVTDVFRTEPDDLEILRKTDSPRLTLITCDDWSYDTETYQQRLVVYAQPLGVASNLEGARDFAQ